MNIWRHSPISFEYTSLWCLLFDPQRTTYHFKCRDPIKKTSHLKTHQLSLLNSHDWGKPAVNYRRTLSLRNNQSKFKTAGILPIVPEESTAYTPIWKWKNQRLQLVFNVRGEPVFNVMAAVWFCEKSGWIGKVEDVKPVLLKKITGFNRQPFWGGGFLPGWIVK